MAELSAQPDIPQDTIVAALGRAAAESPAKVFLDFVGETYTFADIDRLSNALAHGLSALGVEAGQAVATVLDNNVDAVTVWLAINKIGAVSAPVNTGFRGEFLRAQLDDCMAQVVVTESEYAERLHTIIGDLAHVRHVFVRDGAPAPLSRFVTSSRLDDLRSPNTGAVDAEIRPDQLALLIYTSGTTGRSKGCMISHNYACTMGWNAKTVRGVTENEVLWTALPLFHINAIGASVITGLITRARVSVFPRFSVSRFWPEVERSAATTVFLLGSMASLIAEAPDNDAMMRCVGQIRRVSAAPMPPPVAAKWRQRFGTPVAGSSAYGLTEAATVCGSRPGSTAGPTGSSGRPGDDFEVKIVDENDAEVPRGVPGEIVCRPRRPNIMFSGYWNQPEETVKACRNLWFHTGDLGKLDEDGWFYFVDRKKDYIRRRGESISTHELEAVFRQHPTILDVAVHAVSSPIGEDEVKVTAEINPGAKISEEQLCRWSIERLPYFAVPLYVEFRQRLPRGPTGKILKAQLRAEGKTLATWDREAAGVTFVRR